MCFPGGEEKYISPITGHINHARWMPVFLKDMACLPETHPSVHEGFMEGKFVVQRSDKKFSLMALDQSQEHSIKFLRENSEAKGLYGQPEEKEVIALSKPEVLRVIDEFENAVLSASNKEVNLEHPESSVAEQNNFLKDLKALLYLVKEGTVVNPFKETGPKLVTLDTGEVMDPWKLPTSARPCLQSLWGTELKLAPNPCLMLSQGPLCTLSATGHLWT